MNYADTLGAPFVLSSNDGVFLMHDRTGLADRIGQELTLDAFPSPVHVAPLFNGKGWNQPKPSPTWRQAVTKGQQRIYWSWRPALTKPTRHFRSSGGCGNPVPRNVSAD
jgi:hypothetical protein